MAVFCDMKDETQLEVGDVFVGEFGRKYVTVMTRVGEKDRGHGGGPTPVYITYVALDDENMVEQYAHYWYEEGPLVEVVGKKKVTRKWIIE